MEEAIEKLADEPGQQPAPKTNRGWFRPEDRRINREGRPRGRKVGAPDGTPPVDCAKRADRVMVLFVPERVLARRMTGLKAAWAANLPPGFRFVDGRFDAARNGFVLTIQSDRFARVARGAPIPEFDAKFYGMMWNK